MKTHASLFIIAIAVLSSCQKEYTCVCTTASTGQECTFEKQKTTKLGKAGLRKTCLSHENTNTKDCDLH